MSCYVKKYRQNLVVDLQFTQHLIMLLAKVFLLKNHQKKTEDQSLIACLKTIH